MVDSVIILYEATETSFTTNGLGYLPDASSCTVTEERNGEFELEMVYPITGKRYSEITLRRIILAKPNPYAEPQPFRIYSMSKPISGLVTINAEHISYDLSGYPVSTFTATSASSAMTLLKSKSAVTHPFTFWTDKTTSAKMEVTAPSSIRSLLGGDEGSILDTYGGEYEFDKFTVKLHANRGKGRGVSIRYGKNLTDLTQEENCSNVYTGAYPYWYSEEDGLVEATGKIVNAEGTYSFTRILVLDFSSAFDKKPTAAQLKTAAEQYMSENKVGIPTVSLDVSFASLANTEEYKDIALLETVYLCDTVNVEFPELGVSATAKCIKTEYDVLTNKYSSIELGEAKSNLASTVAEQSKAIEAVPTKSFLEQAIDTATQLITGGLGGYVVIHSSTNDSKHPDEILIMNSPDISKATKVWRWNQNGFGYSSTGYNGPYKTAITMNGAIVADFITAGTMQGNIIKAGTISANDGDSYWDLDGDFAKFIGIFRSESTGGYYIQISNGAIEGGYNGTKYGYIDYSAKIKNLATGVVRNGINIISGAYRIMSEEVATKSTTDNSQTALIGATGTVPIVTSITSNGDGSISWTYADYQFENGLLVTSLSNTTV